MPFQMLDKVPHVITPSVSHDNLEQVVQAETSEDSEDVQANTTTLLRIVHEPKEVCEGVITAVPVPAEESVPPILVPLLPATVPAPPPATADPPTLIAAPPPPPITVPPLLDSNQDPRCINNGPTELEIALAAPNLGPEVRKYLQQKKFQCAKKVEPGNTTTAR